MSEAPRDSEDRNRAYWRANLNLMLILLSVWFAVSFLAGIVFVDVLDQYRLFGYKLGFWFAQQGSMYGFVAIIFFYASRMKAIDRKFGVHD